MAQGDSASLVAWLGKHIHQHGRKITPSEIVQRATGQPLSHKPFVRYTTAKFSELYGL
jgi:carboxypeptidase Taq